MVCESFILPVLHAIGLPALCQLQGADSRLAPGGDVVIAGVPVEIPTKATHLVLEPLAHCDAQGVKAVVAYLDVLRCVDDNETFRCGQACHQACYKWYRYRCAINLGRQEAGEVQRFRFLTQDSEI